MYPLKPAIDVSAGFILAVLLGHRFSTYAESVSVRSGMPKINRAELAGYTFALPPLPEQRAIAEALSDVDALLGALDRLIAKKRDLKQAAMQQLLTGQTRLPGFHGEWDVAFLGNLLTMKATYGIVTAGNFKNTGVPMLRGGDIKNGRIGSDLPLVSPEKSVEYSRTILKRDDVVIALVGYPGEAAKVPPTLEGANISRAVGLLRLNNKITPDYLVSYLNSPVGKRMVLAPSAGSAQLVVNLAELNMLQFPLPPPLPEQTAIADVLANMDAELAALEQRRDKTRALKQGMMQELLTGRTRLI
jgi:type I restriction enzyme S subunit